MNLISNECIFVNLFWVIVWTPTQETATEILPIVATMNSSDPFASERVKPASNKCIQMIASILN
jgi:hypothetical protein